MEGRGFALLGTATGEPILSNEEVREAQRAAEKRARAAEAELARLRAEIERLRGGQG